MRQILLSVLSLSLLIFSGCRYSGMSSEEVMGSGTVETVSVDLASFDSIMVSSGFSVTIHQAPEYSVSVTADDNLIDSYIGLFMNDSTLILQLPYNVLLQGGTLEADIYLPELSLLTVKDGSKAEIVARNEPFTKVHVYNNSEVTGTLNAAQLFLDSHGASSQNNRTIDLTGTIGELYIDSAGGGSMRITALPAYVEISCFDDALISIEDPGTSGVLDWVNLEIGDSSRIRLPSVNLLTGSMEDTSTVVVDGTLGNYYSLKSYDDSYLTYIN